MGMAMKNLLLGTAFLVAWAALAAAPARAEEATFQRDLTVSGRVDLTVQTGSGSIHLTVGPAGHVHIFGHVKSNWGGSDAQVHEIADHPPVEQTGNIVRIGARHENFRNISIDYEVQVPPDAFLNAGTGSGNVTDDGVGANAKLNTGSGSIHATGLQGGFTVETGSGSIYAEQAGTGDVKAETGSGSIELRNLHGGLHAETGSGNIKADGTPSAQWRLQAGSGSIEIWTGAAAFTLNAETGSGSIHCDREIASQGTMEHHHLAGKIGGGGPMVRINTGSGGIHIH
jgi:opacity protein-like surface antigen